MGPGENPSGLDATHIPSDSGIQGASELGDPIVSRPVGETPNALDAALVGDLPASLVPSHPIPSLHTYPFLSPPDRAGELGWLGRYRVVKLLGEGGMGIVFLAEHKAIQKPVALKVLLPELAADPTSRERFLRECRAAAVIASDHVATTHEVGEVNGALYLAMEYLRGQNLEDWLKTWQKTRQQPVPATVMIRVAHDVLKGLEAAHKRGVFHGDLKPTNLWVESQTGRVKVLGFGLTQGGSAEALTGPGQVLGTPAYMSPEQARGLPVDARADLFSLGVVLYRMVAGRNPFQRDSAFATLAAVAVDDPPPTASYQAVPDELAGLIDQLMAKAPDRRPALATAALAVVVEIEQQLRAQRATGRTTPPEPPTTRPALTPTPVSPPRRPLPRGKVVDDEEEGPHPRRARSRRPYERGPRGRRKPKRGLGFKLLIAAAIAVGGCFVLGFGGLVAVGIYGRVQEQKIVGNWAIDPLARENADQIRDKADFRMEFKADPNRCVLVMYGVERRGTWDIELDPQTSPLRVTIDVEAKSQVRGPTQRAFVAVFDITVIDQDHIEVVDISGPGNPMRFRRVGR